MASLRGDLGERFLFTKMVAARNGFAAITYCLKSFFFYWQDWDGWQHCFFFFIYINFASFDLSFLYSQKVVARPFTVEMIV